MNFSFFTMEFWLSGSLSRERFFHDGISAITEPFHDFFHMVESWQSQSLFHEFFFHMMESQKMYDVGEDSFRIYHKEYLHRICLVKNLAS
jgi:hypothetical protein